MIIKKWNFKPKCDVVAGFKWDGDVPTRIGVKIGSSSPIQIVAPRHPEEHSGLLVASALPPVTAAGVEKMSKYHGEIVRGADGAVDLVAEMGKHPDALWIRVKAIEADRENDNGDYFSEEEILKSYKTFEGCPVFTNHENNKVEAAKGKVVKADWDPGEKAVYCTMFIDRAAHPGLCRAIEEGYVTDVSMGTQVDYSTCSICEKRAMTADDYCFVPGSLVLMSDLTVRNIEDVRIGDEVIDSFGNAVRVIHTFVRDVNEQIRVFKSRSITTELMCTGNHKLFVLGESGPKAAHAECVKDNYFLAPIYRPEPSEAIFSYFSVDESKRKVLARILGYYAAEGCPIYDKNEVIHGIEFSLGRDEVETQIGAEIASSVQSLFGKDVEVIDGKKYGSDSDRLALRFYDRIAAPLIVASVPGKATTKTLSQAIINMPDSYLLEFMAAYADGDGHADKYGHIILSTASRSLASQVYHVLLRLGVSPNIGEYPNSGGPSNREKDCLIHRTEICNAHVRKMGLDSIKCRKASKTIKTANRLSNIFTEDGMYSKHKPFSVETQEYSGPVYNIETESGTYVVSNTSAKNCDHVKTMKGRQHNGRKIFEKNYGLKFIEISVVTDGACKDCTIREIIDPQEYVSSQAPSLMRAADKINEFVKNNASGGADLVAAAQESICDKLSKVADIYEQVVKTATMTKDSGQAEIQKLNQAMDLLEDVSRTMLDQRQYIDLEFLSKLVDVFADLQKVNDELVDQGYASVGGGNGQQPQSMPAPANQMPPPAAGKEPGMETANQAGAAPTGVGKITEPATASSGSAKTIFSAKLEELHSRAMKILEEAKLSRGDDEVDNKHQETKEKLARIWQSPSVKKFQTQVSDGQWHIVIGTEEIYGLKGTEKVATLKVAELDPDIKERLSANPRETGELMLDALKNKHAGLDKKAEAAPVDGKEQVTKTMEAQLRDLGDKLPLHPRENDIRTDITELQLDKKGENNDMHARQEKPRDSITEKQLHSGDAKGYEDDQKPQDKPRTATFEKQLRDTDIKGNSTPAEGGPWAAGVTDQNQQIHEGQLQDWLSADKPAHPDSITEKQLRELADPLGRRVDAAKLDPKTVLAAAAKAMTRTAIATGATPEEVLAAVSMITATPRIQIAAVEKAVRKAAKKEQKEARASMLRRAAFHGVNALSVASRFDIADYLLGSLNDAELDPEAGITALKVLASQKGADKKLADAIAAGLEEASEKVASPLSMEDMLKQALAETDTEESVKVILAEKDLGDHKDEAAFAKAAFEMATKVASQSGVKITQNVHVAKKDGSVEVEMRGVKAKETTEAKKEIAPEAKTANEVEARKEARAKLVEAQMPGGGGEAAPGMGAGGPAAGAGAAGGGTTMPSGGPGDAGAAPPVSALGEQPPAPGEEGADEGGEALPPGSICPVCGSDDVDIRAGQFDCNSCGATGTFSVKIEVESWPGTLEDKGAGAKADEGAAGGEGGPIGGEEGGMEMPPVGLQASFKVTPEMIKVAGSKPIGSFCPHCGSSKVKLASKSGSALGNCEACGGTYSVDTYVDAANLGELWATVQWEDLNVRKFARQDKRTILRQALKAKGLEAKYAKGDLATKADIIALLHDDGLLK